MTDSTVENLNHITGAGGLESGDLFYVVRSGSPDADFKAASDSVLSYIEGAAPAFAAVVHTHTLSSITDAGALASLNMVGTSQIDNDAITYAKIQNISATDKILGRASVGAGD